MTTIDKFLCSKCELPKQERVTALVQMRNSVLLTTDAGGIYLVYEKDNDEADPFTEDGGLVMRLIAYV